MSAPMLVRFMIVLEVLRESMGMKARVMRYTPLILTSQSLHHSEGSVSAIEAKEER